MSFDRKFPNADFGTRTRSGFFKAGIEGRCCACDELTRWLHADSLLYVCGERCFAQHLPELSDANETAATAL